MKKVLLGSLCILVLMIAGCGEKKVESSKVKDVQGVIYSLTDEKPFTGIVVEKISEKQTKQKKSYKNGQLEGDNISYFDNGKVQMKAKYKEGKLSGKYSSFYDNGKRQMEGVYLNGKHEGVFKTYYENGNIRASVTYKNGRQKGPYIIYDENGNIKMKGMI